MSSLSAENRTEMKGEAERGYEKLETSPLSRFPSFIVTIKFLAWEAEYCFLTIGTHTREENRKLHVRRVRVRARASVCTRARMNIIRFSLVSLAEGPPKLTIMTNNQHPADRWTIQEWETPRKYKSRLE